MEKLIFILSFITLAFCSVGLGSLYLYMIRKDELLGFMQKPLEYLKPKKGPLAIFLYKSFGGCDVCTIQRFADLIFALLIVLTPLKIHPGLWFIFYCLFGGLIFYINVTMAKKENKVKVTKEKLKL